MIIANKNSRDKIYIFIEKKDFFCYYLQEYVNAERPKQFEA